MAEFLKKTAALNRVEPVPNSEYVPISELHLVTCDNGTYQLAVHDMGIYSNIDSSRAWQYISWMSTVLSKNR